MNARHSPWSSKKYGPCRFDWILLQPRLHTFYYAISLLCRHVFRVERDLVQAEGAEHVDDFDDFAIGDRLVGGQKGGGLFLGRGEALSVLNLDQAPPAAALDDVRAHAAIRSATIIKLPPAGERPAWLAG